MTANTLPGDWDFSMLDEFLSSSKHDFLMHSLYHCHSSGYERNILILFFVLYNHQQACNYSTKKKKKGYLSLYLFHFMYKISSSKTAAPILSLLPLFNHLYPNPGYSKMSAAVPNCPEILLLFHLHSSNIQEWLYQIMNLTHQCLPKLWLFMPKYQSSSTGQKTGQHGRLLILIICRTGDFN